MNREQVLMEITRRIRHLKKPHPARVAIDGVDAAGKTALSNELAFHLTKLDLHVIQSSTDGFHNPRAIRYRRGNESPEGYYLDSFDYPSIIKLVLEPLGPGGDLRYRPAIFDYRVDFPVDEPYRQAQIDSILLFDGIFLLRPELRNYWDLTIFVQVSFDVILDRAIQRVKGAAEVYQLEERYRKRYIPGQRIYFRACQPEQRADIVIENNDLENPTLRIKGETN